MRPPDPTKASAQGPADQAASGQSRVGTWVRGKYHLDRELGEGGMAVVYAATHRNKKRFAVKVLRPELSNVQDVRTRFLREGYVANTVDHPGAVAVLDDDIGDDGCAFLVMELLEGDSVEALADRHGGRLSIAAVIAIAYQLTDVLAAAHAKNVIHRDLKPANLFLTTTGQVKVLDFGIARLREAHLPENATHTGIAMGTPAFMGPEQARGKSSQIGPRTDLWAVGATIFTLLSGENVHQGESPQEVLFHAGSYPARSLATVRPDAPAALVAVVDRALAFDLDHRWHAAAAMRDALGAAYSLLFAKSVSSEPLDALCRQQVKIRASHPDLAIAAGIESQSAQTVVAHAASGQAQPAAAAQQILAMGRTTAQPVSATPARTAAAGRPERAVRLGVAGIALLGIAIGAFAFARRAADPAPLRAVVVPTPEAIMPLALPSSPSASAAQPANQGAVGTEITAVAVDAGVAATTRPPPISKPAPTKRPSIGDFDRR